MSEVVYEIRNFSSKLLSYHGSRFALGYVANEREAVIFAVGISASFRIVIPVFKHCVSWTSA